MESVKFASDFISITTFVKYDKWNMLKLWLGKLFFNGWMIV